MKLFDIAQYLEAKLYGNGDIIITGIGSVLNAQPGQITYLSDLKLRIKLLSCRASAVLLTEKDLSFCKSAALVVHDPYLAYAKLAQLMYVTPKTTFNVGTGVFLASDVICGKRISIGSNTIIHSGVVLDDDVNIGSGTIIGRNTKIGVGTCIFSNVTICHEVEIGKYCVIQSGTVIGSDGFGYANDRGNWIKIPQLGRVVIGDRVEIGSCTTIDRGSLDNTIINNGVIIDNQCHIAHNVVIGKNTAIAGGVVMGGSVTIGQYCMIGGATVINGHIEICDKVIVTGMSMVIKKITKPGVYSSGIPVQLNKKWRKTAVLVMNINNLNKRIKVIEQKINE